MKLLQLLLKSSIIFLALVNDPNLHNLEQNEIQKKLERLHDLYIDGEISKEGFKKRKKELEAIFETATNSCNSNSKDTEESVSKKEAMTGDIVATRSKVKVT